MVTGFGCVCVVMRAVMLAFADAVRVNAHAVMVGVEVLAFRLEVVRYMHQGVTHIRMVGMLAMDFDVKSAVSVMVHLSMFFATTTIMLFAVFALDALAGAGDFRHLAVFTGL